MSWRFKYNGPELSVFGRVRVWWWLKQCQRIIKRQIQPRPMSDDEIQRAIRIFKRDSA